MKKRIGILLAALFLACGARATVETWSSGTVNLAVPDGQSSGLASHQTVSSSISSISSVTVTLNVSGNYNGDLYVTLQHGSGFSVLLNRPGRTAANPYGYGDSGFAITLSDSAANDIHSYQLTTVPAAGSPLGGTWQPDARNVDPSTVLDTTGRSAFLGAFNGLGGSGDWTLFVADMDFGGQSTLTSWSMQLSDAPTVPEPVNPALALFGSILLGWQIFRRCRAARRA